MDYLWSGCGIHQRDPSENVDRFRFSYYLYVYKGLSLSHFRVERRTSVYRFAQALRHRDLGAHGQFPLPCDIAREEEEQRKDAVHQVTSFASPAVFAES